MPPSLGTAHGVARGRLVLGPDEDPFTLACEAIEAEFGTAPRTVSEIRIAGALPSSADPLVLALVDGPPHVSRSTDLAAALTGLGPTTPSGTVLLVAFLPALEEAGGGPVALAARFAGPPTSGADETAAALIEAALADVTAAERRRRARPIPEGVSERLQSLDPSAVSEGAYIPRARYIESLPSRWRFEAERCGTCGKTTFPSRGRCAHCGARDGLEHYPLPLDGGTVVAATEIGKGGQPTEFDGWVEVVGPYGVVVVELAPGVRATLQTIDTGAGPVPIGSRVTTRIRRLYPMEGEWRYGRKAIPA